MENNNDAVPVTSGKLTLIMATQPATLGKSYRLTASGLNKKTAGELVSGNFEVKDFATVNDVADLIANVRNDQAIMASLPKLGGNVGRIVTKDAKPDNPGALSRTKDDFGFPCNQRGLMILDYDPQDGTTPMTQSQLWTLLQSVVPGIADAGVLWWSSGSSFIYQGEQEIQGLSGQRIYVLIADISDVERFGTMLARRLWLAGHGRIEVSTSGQRLVRSTFDASMHQAARLDFIGGAICHAPLEQRRGKPQIVSNGGWLDTRDALPSLTAKEEAAYEALVEDAKQKAEPEVRLAQAAWKESRVEGSTQRLIDSGINPVQARERAERSLVSAIGGSLLGDFTITLADGTELTVGAILDDKEKYHGALTRDPLEPDYRNGAQTGKLYLFSAHPVLHSQAHGGKTFRLRRQPSRICLSAGHRAENAEEIARRLVGEPDIFFRGGNAVRYESGRLSPIRRGATIAYLCGTRFAVCKVNAKGDEVAADLDEATANMVLSLLGGA